jgi:hypothetical protein
MRPLFLAAVSGQVFVVKLRLHETILRGLVQVLPERLPVETAAAIVRDIAKWAKALLPLPKAIEDFMSEPVPALDVLEDAAASLVELLSDVKGSKGGDRKPLRRVLDSMVKELGAGELSLGSRTRGNFGLRVGMTRRLPFLRDSDPRC